jgi:hypothetical protein
MDDGIKAILLLLSVISITLFVYAYLADQGILVVILIILLVLVSMLIYTCLVVITTKWDNYKTMKEWNNFEALEKRRNDEL